jgi:hypothetical protein
VDEFYKKYSSAVCSSEQRERVVENSLVALPRTLTRPACPLSPKTMADGPVALSLKVARDLRARLFRFAGTISGKPFSRRKTKRSGGFQ